MLTGAMVISADLGIKLENVTLEDLGSADRIVIDKDTTLIIGGRGRAVAVEQRCDEIRRQIKDTTSNYDKDKLAERLAKPSGGIAVIRVGTVSEDGLKRLEEAFDEAINSTKAAAVEGMYLAAGRRSYARSKPSSPKSDRARVQTAPASTSCAWRSKCRPVRSHAMPASMTVLWSKWCAARGDRRAASTICSSPPKRWSSTP